MDDYTSFVKDYNNPNLTAHDVRRINQLNSNRYCKLRALALNNGDIPPVRHMNHTGAKFYMQTTKGDFQVQKTIDGKKVIVGRFPDEDTARNVVEVCKTHNWEINKIRPLIDDKRIKAKNYTLINGYWVIRKMINGENIIFNVLNANTVDESVVEEIVEFYRRVEWNTSYKDLIFELFNIT